MIFIWVGSLGFMLVVASFVVLVFYIVVIKREDPDQREGVE